MKNETTTTALQSYTTEIMKFIPELDECRNAVDAYFCEQSEENAIAVRKNAVQIHDLWRKVDDFVKALADLKSRMEFSIVDVIEKSPELQKEFKIQAGAKSIKCDVIKEQSMRTLMQRYIEKGFDPAFLFSKCSAITAKTAAECFGVSTDVMLEENGDLFAEHQNKPSVKMLY